MTKFSQKDSSAEGRKRELAKKLLILDAVLDLPSETPLELKRCIRATIKAIEFNILWKGKPYGAKA